MVLESSKERIKDTKITYPRNLKKLGNLESGPSSNQVPCYSILSSTSRNNGNILNQPVTGDRRLGYRNIISSGNNRSKGLHRRVE